MKQKLERLKSKLLIADEHKAQFVSKTNIPIKDVDTRRSLEEEIQSLEEEINPSVTAKPPLETPPQSPPTRESQSAQVGQDAESASIQRQLENSRRGLALIQERMAEFEDPNSIPSQLRLERVRLKRKIQELENPDIAAAQKKQDEKDGPSIARQKLNRRDNIAILEEDIESACTDPSGKKRAPDIKTVQLVHDLCRNRMILNSKPFSLTLNPEQEIEALNKTISWYENHPDHENLKFPKGAEDWLKRMKQRWEA